MSIDMGEESVGNNGTGSTDLLYIIAKEERRLGVLLDQVVTIKGRMMVDLEIAEDISRTYMAYRLESMPKNEVRLERVVPTVCSGIRCNNQSQSTYIRKGDSWVRKEESFDYAGPISQVSFGPKTPEYRAFEKIYAAVNKKEINIDDYRYTPLFRFPSMKELDLEKVLKLNDTDFRTLYLLLMDEYRTKDGWWNEGKMPKCGVCNEVIPGTEQLRRFYGNTIDGKCFPEYYKKQDHIFETEQWKQFWTRVAKLS
jgi:hypothetical protein